MKKYILGGVIFFTHLTVFLESRKARNALWKIVEIFKEKKPGKTFVFFSVTFLKKQIEHTQGGRSKNQSSDLDPTVSKWAKNRVTIALENV